MDTHRLVEYDSYLCDNCREYIYNEAVGEPALGIAPNTHVDDLPESWHCPTCGADKSELLACTMLDGYTSADNS